jgi:hypothetical protein
MPLENLPDHARIWLFAFEQAPDPRQETLLRERLGALLARWRHKGQAYQAAFTFLHAQLVAVAEPTLATQPSGCAIDGMLRACRRAVEEAGLTLVDPAGKVLARLENGLQAFPKAQLPQLIQEGRLGAGTPILDLSLYSLGDLRSGRLEAPLEATWIGRKYGLSA